MVETRWAQSIRERFEQLEPPAKRRYHSSASRAQSSAPYRVLPSRPAPSFTSRAKKLRGGSSQARTQPTGLNLPLPASNDANHRTLHTSRPDADLAATSTSVPALADATLSLGTTDPTVLTDPKTPASLAYAPKVEAQDTNQQTRLQARLDLLFDLHIQEEAKLRPLIDQRAQARAEIDTCQKILAMHCEHMVADVRAAVGIWENSLEEAKKEAWAKQTKIERIVQQLWAWQQESQALRADLVSIEHKLAHGRLLNVCNTLSWFVNFASSELGPSNMLVSSLERRYIIAGAGRGRHHLTTALKFTMGLGILENRDGRHVPGTVILDQSAAHPRDHDEGLKRGQGRDSHIVLVPQPSDDPNDPLNWPASKKMSVFAIILMGTAFVCVVPAPILNAGIVQVATDLNRSFSDIAKLNGYMLLAIGAVSPFASAFARKYGKRPVFLFSSLIGLVGCLVAEFAGNYNTLVAGRLLQGFGASAYESLCTSVVTDIYFVHKRGFYVALVVFFLSSLSNGVSVLAGLITTKLGWPYNFHILLPFVAIQTILVALFVPETVYNRPAGFNIDRVGSIDISDKEAKADHVEVTDSKTGEQREAIRQTPQLNSFYRNLSLFNGTFTDNSCGRHVCGPPPWGFDAAAVGYVSAGPLVGGALATVFLGLVSDPLIKSMTRRNQGVYEPEFRLPLAIIGGVFSVAGLVGFGHSIEAQQSIYTISTIWGITLFGMSVAASIIMGYALDAQPAHVVEIFIMNITFKNFFFYGLTNFIVEWYMARGATEVFDVIAGITAFLILFTVPMYVYGKRYRHHWGHHNLLVKMRLDEDPVAAH
ncbi:hypothetical protein FALBO_14530 [Fusarium albosuccineum]|uniref:Major facilitator superfamily (MFS) profile domain-containing protein n=1 Tax=Fusarium albosuccineum TaxID=1237068 RepID=A0A8H4KYP0_9HYPO|nr:hypothetical protein FALBO_14530 [Fusarium albosuccineum]